jgi:uncharacterized membrane protein YfcA
MRLTMDAAYTLSGFVVGAIVGLTGVGGGSLMTPLLVLLFGVHPATAVGTDLLYAALTKAGGTAVHASHRTVDWRVTGRLAAGSLPAAALTLASVWYFEVDRSLFSHLISGALGVALLLTAAALVFKARVQRFALAHLSDTWHTRRVGPATVAVGALLGVLVSLSSVGAGALGVTALLFLYPTLPAVRIVGSDLAHAVPLTLVAGLGHWLLGNIDWSLLGALLLGSLPGIWLGSHFAVKVPERWLRSGLAALLVLIGTKLVL